MEDYNIDANVEMPVVTKEVGKDGSSIQEIVSSAVSAAVSAAIAQRPNRKPNIQDITVNIGSAGSATRLYGCIVDTLGGTYRLLLENCRLLSAAEQDNMEFDDDCAGDSIPSVIVPVSAIAGDIGSASIDESMYNMHSLLGIIDDNKSNSTDIVAGGEMSVQAGSLIMFCVEPIDSSVPCRLHFLTTQEKGRVFTNPNDASLLFRVFQGGNAGSGESGSGDGDNGGSGNGESGGDGNVTVNSVEVAIITEDDGDYTSSLTSEQIAESIEDGVPVFVLGDMNGMAFNSSNVMFHAESSNVFAYITTPAGIYKMTIGSNGEVEIEAEGAPDVAELLVETTWAELKALRDGGNLVAGQHYRITDYQCTTSQNNTQSAGHQFDIIVTADDESTLNENARAILHDGDQYFAGCKLSAWKLKYCIDNDKSRFGWACDGVGGFYVQYTNKDTVTLMRTSIIEGKDTVWVYDTGEKEVYYTAENPKTGDSIYSDESLSKVAFTISGTGEVPGILGTGVVWWMRDEFDNELYYDFKNIQFKRYEITGVNDGKGNPYTDGDGNPSSLIGRWGLPVAGRIAVDTETSEWFYTFSSVVDGNVADATLSFDYDYLTGLGSGAGKNVVGYMARGKFVIGDNVFVNEDGNLVCYSNTFGNKCYSNTFGNYCYNNTFGNGVGKNTFGNDCYKNTFGNYCYNNTFGNDCYNNTFGNDCNSNTFGNGVGNNTFGNYCYNNTFGNGCNSNTFGNDCYNNTFGNYFQYNTFGNGVGNNTFGNKCYSNTFGNGVGNNTFGNDVQQLTVFDGVMYCAVVGGSDPSSYVKNAQILNGTRGTDTNNLLTITFVANSNSTQCAAQNSIGELKVWCAADLVK